MFVSLLLLAYVGGRREFNKLLEAGVLLYQLMAKGWGEWTTNEKIHMIIPFL